ncbi:MAG: 2TM domain-containing protein [Chloroflexota bacterium]
MDEYERVEREARKRVEKRIEARSEFVQHLTAYVTVNLMLWAIWLVTGAGNPWPMWVSGFWGIGMVAHAVSYWGEHGGGKERREREIEREVQRELARLYGDGYGKRKNDALYYDDDDDPQAMNYRS